MSKKVKILLVCLVLLVNLSDNSYVAQAQRSSQENRAASARGDLITGLTPTWRAGHIGAGAGSAGVVVADLNADGATDIASCNGGYAYIISRTPSGDYATTWYSDFLDCKKIASGDRDGDGIHELFILTKDNYMLVYNSSDHQQLGKHRVYALEMSEIAVVDVDGDGALEVIIPSGVLSIYNATTFEREWPLGNESMAGSRLAVGNIDADPQLEIVVTPDSYSAENPASIFDAKTKTVEWTYDCFGPNMHLGDTDGDGIAEIVFTESGAVKIFDGITRAQENSLSGFENVRSLEVRDLDDDGTAELLVGRDNTLASLSGYRASDGAELWSIDTSGGDVDFITAGDVNDDGLKEVLWSTSNPSSKAGTLSIGDWVDESIDWISEEMQGMYVSATGDIDNDGQIEIVAAVYDITADFSGSYIQIYNGVTHQKEGKIKPVTADYSWSIFLSIGQLDSDAALEILVGTRNKSYLQSFDGITLAREWQIGEEDSSNTNVNGLIVKNLDEDAVDEIIVGTSFEVYVFDGASDRVQWKSAPLNGPIVDISLGDLDGDSVADLAVSTVSNGIFIDDYIYIFETGGWTEKNRLVIKDEGLLAAAIFPGKLHHPGELYYVTNKEDDYSEVKYLTAVDGKSYDKKFSIPTTVGHVRDLIINDLDGDNTQEFILTGYVGDLKGPEGFLWIGSLPQRGFWEYQLDRLVGNVGGVVASDIDQDGQAELIFASTGMIEVNEITPTRPSYTTTYIPFAGGSKAPTGIYGTVDFNGVTPPAQVVYLRWYDGSNWYSVTTTTTDEGGRYQFKNIPSLRTGEYYYVLFWSPLYLPYITEWHTRSISKYTAGETVHIGDFDIGDVEPLLADSGVVDVPVTFQWKPRPVMPRDSYEFNLYDPSDQDLWMYTDPPLGYTDHFTLTYLPDAFSLDHRYAWRLWVYSPDGGFGITHEWWVTFNSRSSSKLGSPQLSASESVEPLPTRLRDMPGIEYPVVNP